MNTSSLPARTPIVPNAVLGTLIAVVVEVMLFVGFISAFTISRSGAPEGSWPVPGQPRLPAEATALNTGVLLVSGVVLFAGWLFQRRGNAVAKWLVASSWLLGALFVVLQGREWATLLSAGLTLTSSRLGAFFYIIVGCHALHAVLVLIALGMAATQVWKGRSTGLFLGAQVFWYFVVLMWPIIYARVYF